MFLKRFFFAVFALTLASSGAASPPCPAELLNSTHDLHNDFSTFLINGLVDSDNSVAQVNPDREYLQSRRWVELLRSWNEASPAERARISVEIEKQILMKTLAGDEFPQTALSTLGTLREQAAKAEEILRAQLIKASFEVDAAQKTFKGTHRPFFPRWVISLLPFSSQLLKNWDKKKTIYNVAKENVFITKTDLEAKQIEATLLGEVFTAIAGLSTALQKGQTLFQMGQDHPIFNARFEEANPENQNAVLGVIYLYYVVASHTSEQLVDALRAFNQSEDLQELLNKGTGSLIQYFSKTFKASETSLEFYSDLSVIINQIGIPFSDLEKIREKWRNRKNPSEEIKKIIATIQENLPKGQLTVLQNRMQEIKTKIEKAIQEEKGKKLGLSKILALQKLKREEKQLEKLLKITQGLLNVKPPTRSLAFSESAARSEADLNVEEIIPFIASLWTLQHPESPAISIFAFTNSLWERKL